MGLEIFFVFLLGTIFGSLGSVILTRFSEEINGSTWRSFFFGRSFCPNCKKKLGFTELIPLFSYLFLKGKCIGCKKNIPLFYPILETLSGIIFLFSFYFFKSFGIVNYQILALFSISNRIFLLISIRDRKKLELHPVRILNIILISITYFFSGFNQFLGGLKVGFLFLLGFIFIYFFSKFYVRLRKLETLEPGEGLGFGDIFVAPLFGFRIGFFFDSLRLFSFDKLDNTMITLYFIISSGVIGIIIFFIKRFFFGHNIDKNIFIPFILAMFIGYLFLLLFIFRNYLLFILPNIE